MLAALLITALGFIAFLNPREQAVASDITPTKSPTAAATSTRTIALPTPTPTTPGLRNPNFLKDTSLIQVDDACDAPCWHDITPGTTTYEDALNILWADSGFSNIQSQVIPETGPAVAASWQPVGGEVCCQIIAEDGITVDSIFLQFAPDMTVKQVIDTYGEPEYVLGTAGNFDQALMNLYYPEQSMIVFAFVAGASAGTLKRTSEILGVYYTTHDRMDLGIKLSSLYGWKGYESFADYAPENTYLFWNSTPDYKVTQSVTLTPTPIAPTRLPSS